MSCKIIGFDNGPLEVDCKDVTWKQDGKMFEVENPSHPCRCGSSRNKPFCDGSHSKAGFKTNVKIETEVLQNYEGKEISINFNRSICSGASKCVEGLSSVFKSGDGGDWIFPDEDTNENIIKQINACPSGALSYKIKGESFIDSRTTAVINIIKNGPYEVEGISLEGFETPTNASSTKYALCRCGDSRNKPYCDYSHAENSWEDA